MHIQEENNLTINIIVGSAFQRNSIDMKTDISAIYYSINANLNQTVLDET